MLYEPKHTTEGISWNRQVANAKLNLAHLNHIDEVAERVPSKGSEKFLYRSFSVPVMDGRAYYQITKIKKDTPKCTLLEVTLCNGICLDDYCDEVLGEKSTITVETALRLMVQCGRGL